MVRDRLAGDLESLRDRPRQDVHEEQFGLLLLDSECRQRGIALIRERREEREGDGAGTDDVQRQHRGGEPAREVRVGEEDLARDAREQEDQDEETETADGASHLEEDEGSEGSQDPPQPDPPGRKEPSHQHLPGRGREEDVEKLDDQEQPEVSGPSEEHQRADRDGEIDVRNEADRRAEGEVRSAPHSGDGQDQHCEQP